jgi:hypothetical protein
MRRFVLTMVLAVIPVAAAAAARGTADLPSMLQAMFPAASVSAVDPAGNVRLGDGHSVSVSSGVKWTEADSLPGGDKILFIVACVVADGERTAHNDLTRIHCASLRWNEQRYDLVHADSALAGPGGFVSLGYTSEEPGGMDFTVKDVSTIPFRGRRIICLVYHYVDPGTGPKGSHTITKLLQLSDLGIPEVLWGMETEMVSSNGITVNEASVEYSLSDSQALGQVPRIAAKVTRTTRDWVTYVWTGETFVKQD